MLPEEDPDAPSLEVFNGDLSNLVYWKVSLLMAGGLKHDFKVISNPNNFMTPLPFLEKE